MGLRARRFDFGATLAGLSKLPSGPCNRALFSHHFSALANSRLSLSSELKPGFPGSLHCFTDELCYGTTDGDLRLSRAEFDGTALAQTLPLGGLPGFIPNMAVSQDVD